MPAAPRGTPEQILERIELKVLRRLDGLLQGDHETNFRGAGLDFADLRDYRPDDDSRHIDWNVTARMSTPYVREFVEDRELTAWFLIDGTASMNFGGTAGPEGNPAKADLATDLVASLARLLTRSGNRVGVILWDGQINNVIAPRATRDQVLHVLSALGKGRVDSPGEVEAASPASTGDERGTNLGALVRAATGVIRRRSLVFIVSDFISEAGWERPLAQMAERHDVIGLRVVDPLESQLPDAGVIVMQDAETGEQMWVDTGDAGLRERFAALAAERDDAIAASARRGNVDLHVIPTEQDLVSALLDFTERRRTRSL